MLSVRRTACVGWFAAAIFYPVSASGHAVPDIPVRGNFKSDRAATIEVEVDPRCFADDAEHAPYLKKQQLSRLSKDQRKALLAEAEQLIASTLRFHFEGTGIAKPDFACRFEERPDADPDSEGGVGMYASSIGDGPSGLRFHWIEASND